MESQAKVESAERQRTRATDSRPYAVKTLEQVATPEEARRLRSLQSAGWVVESLPAQAGHVELFKHSQKLASPPQLT